MSDRITEDQIRDLIFTFYDRVRVDTMLGPVFEARLAGPTRRMHDYRSPSQQTWSVGRPA